MKHLVAAVLVTLLMPRADAPVSPETFAVLGGRERQFLLEGAATASTKAERADVRLLARQLLAVYLGERALFDAAVTGDGVTTGEPRLAEAQQKDLGVLLATSGAQFDEAFLDQQRKGLERSLALYRSFATDKPHTRLEGFAKDRVAEIEAHLSHLRGLSATAALPLG